MIMPNEPLVGMNCLRVPLWSSDQTFENQLEWFNWQHGCGSKSKMFVGVAFCLLELLHLPNHHSSQFIRSHPISRGTVHPFSRQYSSLFSPGTVPLPANAPAKRPPPICCSLAQEAICCYWNFCPFLLLRLFARLATAARRAEPPTAQTLTIGHILQCQL